MNTYTEQTAPNLESIRNCLRRIARHDDQEFSNQSILNDIDRFVKTVKDMDEVILVPSRLMDRKVGDTTDTIPFSPKHSHHNKKKGQGSVREVLNAADLFNLYNMLNMVKVDLLWGRNDGEDNPENGELENLHKMKLSPIPSANSSSTSLCAMNTSISSATITNEISQALTSSSSTETLKGHVRRPSTVSMSSSNSTSTLSDSESEISNENDSGIESETNQFVDKSTDLARQFRIHLIGLHKSLEQMTEAATYLTARYQCDVDV